MIALTALDTGSHDQSQGGGAQSAPDPGLVNRLSA